MTKGPTPTRDGMRSNAFEAFKVPDYLAIVDQVEETFNASNSFQRKDTPGDDPPSNPLPGNGLQSKSPTFNANNAFNAEEARLIPDGPICIDCRQPVTPNDLFCDPCFQARKVVPLEELTRRREERRKSTEARLRSTPCGSCGRIDWHVTARGDAHCRACFPARRTS